MVGVRERRVRVCNPACALRLGNLLEAPVVHERDIAKLPWRELEVGTVKINAVFGGAPGGAAQPRGASGSGFGFGPELLDELTVTKVVHYTPAPGAA